MLYDFIINHTQEKLYIDIPDDLNQKMAIRLTELSEIDQDLHIKYTTCFGPADPANLDPELTRADYARFMHPSLFVAENDDGELMPDMKYFEVADAEFFEKMMYHWSKIQDYSVQNLLDKIEDNNLKRFVDTASVIDIIT